MLDVLTVNLDGKPSMDIARGAKCTGHRNEQPCDASSAALTLAGFHPVRGREYYDLAALPIVLDIADHYPHPAAADVSPSDCFPLTNAGWQQVTLFAS